MRLVRPLRYDITTLGCRVNHAESREIESLLLERGLVRTPRGATPDLVVVHTCSVTTTAAAKSRHAVRRALRTTDRPDQAAPHVIVTGCYASTNTREAASIIGDHAAIIPHHDDSGHDTAMIGRIRRQVDAWLDRRAGAASGPPGPVDSTSGHCTGPESSDAAPPLRMPDRLARSGVRPAAIAPIRPKGPDSSPTILSLPVTPLAANAGRHVRAELKIQDGCDAHCTFCIIPSIRRTLRSKAIADAVAEARQLVDRGHAEIVLTGVFIGAYGHETALRRRQAVPGAQPLADLVDAVAQVPGLQRLRVSSMEPGDVTGPLLDAMVANAPVTAPHLHLPLQSGSDAILKRMNRQYRVGEYLEMIDQVNEGLTIDGLPPAITTDIICGFPGETAADFEATRAVAERVGYLHMHVFPYSDRPGTAAARWKRDFVPAETAKARVRTLIDLEAAPDGLSMRYRRRFLGRTVRMIVEQPHRGRPGWVTGRCDHYALIATETDASRGSVIDVVVTDVHEDGMIGEVQARPIPLPLVTLNG